MRLRKPALSVFLVLLCGGLAACGSSSSGKDEQPAGKVEKVRGQERIVLTREAAARIGIQTAQVRREGAAEVIPSSALMYEANGATYAYVQVAPTSYVRTAVKVDRIDGKRTLLSSGPAPGAAVVRVGADELRGTEIGVEEE